jgi:hypothetical protein
VYKPRRFYRRLYCQLYQTTEDELWPPIPTLPTRPAQQDSSSPDRDPVVVALWDVGGTVAAAVALTGSGGLDRRTFVFLTGAALTVPAHQWLVHEPEPLVAALKGDRVTPKLADRLPPMISELRRMDDISGGDVVLDLAQREFSWVAGLLKRASYDEPTARKLHLALAELGVSTGYFAYDAGLDALAQRYWIAALRAARTADAPALGGYILCSMANQATEHHQPAEAATLVETGLAGTRGRQTPALMARLYMNQANAQALLRDDVGCARAAAKADSWAERIEPEREPPQLYWLNPARATLDKGRALLRLGRADQAVRPLAEGVRQLDDSMVRDRQLYLTDWAEALARPGRQRDVEQAASRGLEAIALTEELTSTRGTHRIRDLRRAMKPHAKVPVVREFLERARELT